MEHEQRFGRVDGVVHRWVTDKVLALSRDGTASTIEGLAAIVWEVTTGPRTIEEIVAATRDLAPTDRRDDPEIETWVVDAIGTLVDAHLLVELGST